MEFHRNLYAPTSSCTTINKRLLGALGIPELNRLIGDGISQKEKE